MCIRDSTIAFDNYLNQQLIPLQQKYTATYTCDYPEGIDGASRYQQEYLSLQNIELERHKEELAQAQVRCKDRFRKEVLFRMKAVSYTHLDVYKRQALGSYKGKVGI